MNLFTLEQGDFGILELIEQKNNLLMHAHLQKKISFWVDGGTSHTRSRSERSSLNADEATIIGSQVSHELRLDNIKLPVVMLNIYFDELWLSKNQELNNSLKSLSHGSIQVSKELKILIEKIVNYLHFNTIGDRGNVKAILDSMLPILVSGIDLQKATFSKHEVSLNRAPLVDYRLKLAIAYMKKNLDNPCSTEEIADLVGLSRSRFFDLFEEQLNSTPSVFWKSMRLEQAIRLLSEGKEKLTSVALELGFSSPGNFSRFFREHRGVSPSLYRKVSCA